MKRRHVGKQGNMITGKTIIQKIKKHWFHICILCIFCVMILAIGSAIWAACAKEKSVRMRVARLNEHTAAVLYAERSKIDQKDICIVSEGIPGADEYTRRRSLSLRDRYLVVEDYRYWDRYIRVFDNNRVHNIDHYIIRTYDVDTLALVQEVDVKAKADELLRKYPDYFIDGVYLDTTQSYGILLHKIPSSENIRKRFRYSILTDEQVDDDFKQQKTEPMTDEERKKRDKYNAEFDKLELSNPRGDQKALAAQYGLDTFYCSDSLYEPGRAEVRILCEELPVKNQGLYSRFPGLQAYQGQTGKMVSAYFYNYQDPLDLLQMFLEDGTELHGEQ